MVKVSTVASAVVLALIALASVEGYLYVETSASLSAASVTMNQYSKQLRAMQSQIDSLDAQLKAQGAGSTSGTAAQLATMASVLTSLKNASISASFKSVLSALQEQLNDLQTVAAACGGSIPVSQRPVGNLTPVLLMQPGTMATVCVTYRASWSDDPAAFNVTKINSFWFRNGSYPFGMNVIKNNSVSHSFTITPSPSSVRPSANVTYVTVAYSITALPNSTGFYDSTAPYGYCGTMPMAVGYSASQVNGSDFPPRPLPHSCIAIPYIPTFVSVTGMGVVYMDIPPGRLYMSTSAGSGYETSPQYSGYVPTWTGNRADAYIFDCMASAASTSGCSVHLGNATIGFDLRVWYPVSNQSMPWASCAFVISNTAGQTPRDYAVCIPLSSTSFIIAEAPEPLT